MKDIKNKKKNQRKEQNKETDDFDELFNQYKKKLDLKIGAIEKKAKKDGKPEFEEFSMSD